MNSHLLFSLSLVEFACVLLTGYLWASERRVRTLSQLCIAGSGFPILLVFLLVVAGNGPEWYAVNPKDTLEIALPTYVAQMVMLGCVALFGLDARLSDSPDRRGVRILLTFASAPGVVFATLLFIWFPK